MPGHVLLIDDEPYFRFGIELAIRKRGYRVSQVSDGKEALRRILGSGSLRSPLLDLILLDLELASFPGAEIVSRMRAAAVATPVIALSGYFNAARYEELMKLGSLELMFKPVSEQLLLDSMERALKLGRLR